MPTPLVLVPGLLCDGRLWSHQVEGLSDVADPVVADVPMRGSVGGMARDVLRRAPDTFALSGLSMGGYIALEIMRQAPERVTALALLDTSARRHAGADAGPPRAAEARRGGALRGGAAATSPAYPPPRPACGRGVDECGHLSTLERPAQVNEALRDWLEQSGR